MPSSGTFSIGTNSRDYSTIGGWEADTDVSLTGKVVGECYNDSAFDEIVNISGANSTSSTVYRELTVASGERHNATKNSGAILDNSLSGGDTSIGDYITLAEDFARLGWLEVTISGGGNSGSATVGVDVNNQGCHIHHCFFWEFDTQTCIDTDNASGSGPYEVYCNLFLDIGWDGAGTAGNIVSNNGPLEVFRCYNNSVFLLDRGNIDFCFASGQSTDVFKNNAALWDTGSISGVTGFSLGAGVDAVSENNASSDGTADDFGGTGHLVNQNALNWYKGTSSGSEDLHLQSSANGVDAGEDLGDVPAKIDIDGFDRHANNVTWDIGADEEVVPRPARVVQSIGRSIPSLGRALTRGV